MTRLVLEPIRDDRKIGSGRRLAEWAIRLRQAITKGWFGLFSSTKPTARRANQEAGFTLLELLVVIVILGLLIGLVAPAALRQLSGARLSVARQSIERIGGVLDLYKLDMGTYPATDQGLAALAEQPVGATTWNGPYLKGGVPVDPWSHPYIYRNPSTRSGHDYDLCSIGPDSAASSQICNP
jgi:general secretion pathway protein G